MRDPRRFASESLGALSACSFEGGLRLLLCQWGQVLPDLWKVFRPLDVGESVQRRGL